MTPGVSGLLRKGLICLLAICLPVGPAQADDALGLPGLVNTDCQARDGRPPLVLIHGTFASARRAFSSVAPVLKAEGHCLFALNYGRPATLAANGMADINQSTQEVSAFVRSVLDRTGAGKVTLIGHSQGGLLAFLVAGMPALSGHIDRIVAVAPSLHGTTRVPAALPAAYCAACAQQAADSAFMLARRGIPLNPPGVRAFILATRQDAVVTPVAAQFLDEPGVTNQLLQDAHPALRASHSGLMHVPEAVALIRDFLAAP